MRALVYNNNPNLYILHNLYFPRFIAVKILNFIALKNKITHFFNSQGLDIFRNNKNL